MDETSNFLLHACLTQLGCAQYLSIFLENEIDFDSFKLLTREDLATLLPGKLGPQKKILAEIKRIQEIDGGSSEKDKVEITKSLETTSISSGSVKIEAQQTSTTVSKLGNEPMTDTTTTADAPPAAAQGVLARYGFALPSVGGFATGLAIDTVKKHMIERYTYPLVFGGGTNKTTPAEPTNATTTNPETDPGASSTTASTAGPEGSDPAMSAYLAKYGPNASASAPTSITNPDPVGGGGGGINTTESSSMNTTGADPSGSEPAGTTGGTNENTDVIDSLFNFFP